MKKVEIYDQYSPVYIDTAQNNQFVVPSLMPGQTVQSTLILVHPSSGSVVVVEENLTEQAAKQKVTELYEVSKTLGSSYTDKIINSDQGYAELKIQFTNGKRLNRVIYISE